MDRRLVLAGLAGAVAGPALAQTTQPAPAPTTAQPTGAASGGAAGGTYAQMSQADMQHMQQTAMVGMLSLETSKIALEKARDSDVKQFAQFERDEQETISEVLRSMVDPALMGNNPQAMMPQMDAKGREMIQKLQQAQAGAGFDKEYVQGQIDGHQQLLQIQETYLKSNSKNREHMNVAKLARGQIKEHIALLQDMSKKMK